MDRRRVPLVTHTHALLTGQSHSIPDNLVALFATVRAWNCSPGNCGSYCAGSGTAHRYIAGFRVLYPCRSKCDTLPALLLLQEQPNKRARSRRGGGSFGSASSNRRLMG